MNAIRGNDRIRHRGCAVGKSQSDTVVDLIESNQPMAQLDAFVGDRPDERSVQVAAMGEQIGRTEPLLGGFAENHVELHVARSPVPVVPGARVERLCSQSFFESELAQDLHGIAADLDSRTDPRELRGLLVHRDIDADPPQRRGARETAHPGTDDCD